MVDDNLVKLILSEWLVHFGTQAVTYDVINHTMGDVIFNQYPNSDMWDYILNEGYYIHYDPYATTWHLTDAGIKYLQ